MLLGVAGALAVLLVAAAAGEIAGWPFLQGPVQRAFERAAAVPVTMDGRFRVHALWHPRIEVEHLRVGAGGGVPAPHLLDAQEVRLQWRWTDIWRWHHGAPLRLHRLSAERVDARLLRDADGHATWQIGRHAADQPAAPPPRIGSLRLGQGSIVFDDRVGDTLLTVTLQGGERAASAPPSDRTASGYEARVSGRYRQMPVSLHVHSAAVLPLLGDGETDGGDAPVAVRVEGRAGASQLLFDGHAGALAGAPRLQGALHFSGPSLALVAAPLGLALPQTPPFDLKGEISQADGVWHLRADRASLGRSLLNGDFRYDTRPATPLLTGQLAGPRLALADLGPAVGTPVPAQPKVHRPGRVLPQREFHLPSLRAMDADVDVAVDALDFGTDALTPLHDLQTHLVLKDAELRLEHLKATVAGGRFSGSSSLDARREPARWAADLHFDGVEVSDWIQGLRTAAGTATARGHGAAGARGVQAYLTGRLDAQVDVTGRGRSTAEILGSLDGRAKVSLHDATLSHLATEALGLDVAQALGVVISGDRALPLRCARVDLRAHDGVVKLQRAVADNSDSTLRVAGQINLADESLALVARAQPKDFSPFTLRSPIAVGGTLSAPSWHLQPGALAGKAAGAALLAAALGPLAALLPFVDPGSDAADHRDPCAAEPAPAASAPAASAARGAR